jgi:hypothetical protein
VPLRPGRRRLCLASRARRARASGPASRSSASRCSVLASFRSPTLADPHYTDELVELWTELAELRPDASTPPTPPRRQRRQRQFAPTSRSHHVVQSAQERLLCHVLVLRARPHRLVPALLRLSRGAVSSLLSPDVDVFQAAVLQTIRLSWPTPIGAPHAARARSSTAARAPAGADRAHARARPRAPQLRRQSADARRPHGRRRGVCRPRLPALRLRGRRHHAQHAAARLDRRRQRQRGAARVRAHGERASTARRTSSPQLYRAAGSVHCRARRRALRSHRAVARRPLLATTCRCSTRASTCWCASAATRADALVADMRARGLVPDRYTFNTMLFAVAQQHKVLSAAQPPNLVRIADARQAHARHSHRHERRRLRPRHLDVYDFDFNVAQHGAVPRHVRAHAGAGHQARRAGGRPRQRRAQVRAVLGRLRRVCAGECWQVNAGPPGRSCAC